MFASKLNGCRCLNGPLDEVDDGYAVTFELPKRKLESGRTISSRKSCAPRSIKRDFRYRMISPSLSSTWLGSLFVRALFTLSVYHTCFDRIFFFGTWITIQQAIIARWRWFMIKQSLDISGQIYFTARARAPRNGGRRRFPDFDCASYFLRKRVASPWIRG